MIEGTSHRGVDGKTMGTRSDKKKLGEVDEVSDWGRCRHREGPKDREEEDYCRGISSYGDWVLLLARWVCSQAEKELENIFEGKLDGRLVEIKVRVWTPLGLFTLPVELQISSSVLSVIRLHCTPLLFSIAFHSAPLMIFPAH
jgi:hypothetical protein